MSTHRAHPTAAAVAVLTGSLALVTLSAQTTPTVYFGNLHSHTALSDGSGVPDEAYAHARNVAGLDFLAITEHNHIQAGDIARIPQLYTGPGRIALIPSARDASDNGEFVALYGQEFSTIPSGNHMNVIDAPDVITTESGDVRGLLEDWLPANLDSTGRPPLLLLNHPATRRSPRDLEYGLDDYGGDVAQWRAALDPRAQLINLVNGPSHSGSRPGRPSESEFHRYLNLGLHVAPTADQDNHRRDWGSVVSTRTAVLADELTKPALLAAMRQRRVYATEDANLRLHYTVNGELLGSLITGSDVPAVGSALALELEIEDDDEPTASYQIEVFSDAVGGSDTADVVSTVSASGDGTVVIDGVTYDGGEQYVFLRITQNGQDRAWTAPVWVGADAAPPPTGTSPTSLVTLVVDEVAEEARIENVGTEVLELSGWRLVSVRGNQVFDQFPDGFSLAPGEAVTVTSGSGARSGPGFLLWTSSNIWRNAGDPGQLFDSDGQLVAETGN